MEQMKYNRYAIDYKDEIEKEKNFCYFAGYQEVIEFIVKIVSTQPKYENGDPKLNPHHLLEELHTKIGATIILSMDGGTIRIKWLK